MVKILKTLLNPARLIVIVYKINNFIACRFRFLKPICQINMIIMKILSGIEIELGAKIGKNLQFIHGNGVVIGNMVEIGDNVKIYQNVTIGGNFQKTEIINGKVWHQPQIGNNVILCPGAKILGPISIDPYTIIGANTVITENVDSYKLVLRSGTVIYKDIKNTRFHKILDEI